MPRHNFAGVFCIRNLTAIIFPAKIGSLFTPKEEYVMSRHSLYGHLMIVVCVFALPACLAAMTVGVEGGVEKEAIHPKQNPTPTVPTTPPSKYGIPYTEEIMAGHLYCLAVRDGDCIVFSFYKEGENIGPHAILVPANPVSPEIQELLRGLPPVDEEQ